MPDFGAVMEFGKTFGFPALCLAVVIWLLWRGAGWMARELVVPMRDRLFRHFDKIEELMGTVSQGKTCRYPPGADPGARDVPEPERLPPERPFVRPFPA